MKALEEKTNKFNDQLHQLLLRYEVMDHSKNIVNQTFCYYQNSFQELNSLLNTHTQQIDQWTERVNCIRLRTMGGEYLDETEIQRIQQSVEEESTQILSIQNHINHIESLLCIESQSE